MRKIIAKYVVPVLYLLIPIIATAQHLDSKLDKEYDDKYNKINFSVPDIPAFKALSIENSNILMPSTVRDFAFSFSPFYTNGKVSLPQNFALELSPAQLNEKINTLNNYNRKSGLRLLLNSSISVGTIRDSTNQTLLSIGYRGMFIKKNHDLRRHFYQMAELDKPQKISKNMSAITSAIADNYNLREFDDPSSENYEMQSKEMAEHVRNIKVEMQNDQELNSKIKANVEYIESIINDFSELSDSDILSNLENRKEQIVKKSIEAFENEYWNATRLDIAFAYTARSEDSALKGAIFNSFDVWVTNSIRLNKNWQLLLGINGKIPFSTSMFAYEGTVSSRLYGGVNKLKGILEVQYVRQDNLTGLSESSTASVGGEFKLGGVFWVVVLAGYQNAISGSFFDQFVSSLNLKYGIN